LDRAIAKSSRNFLGGPKSCTGFNSFENTIGVVHSAAALGRIQREDSMATWSELSANIGHGLLSETIMKTSIISAAIAASLLLAGCGKQPASPYSKPQPAAAPVVPPTVDTWLHGDKSAAISSFAQADWTGRPLFAPGSGLSLSEDQFKRLSAAERQAASTEILPQLDALKWLAAAVAQAGRDAAAKGDAAQARKYFTSLQLCGAALQSPDCLGLVQVVGKSLKKLGDSELAKIGQ
jgi:hypothetical protein